MQSLQTAHGLKQSNLYTWSSITVFWFVGVLIRITITMDLKKHKVPCFNILPIYFGKFSNVIRLKLSHIYTLNWNQSYGVREFAEIIWNQNFPLLSGIVERTRDAASSVDGARWWEWLPPRLPSPGALLY